MYKAVGYVRVSDGATDDQVSGLRESIEIWCRENRYALDEVFCERVEAGSGTPCLDRVLDKATQGSLLVTDSLKSIAACADDVVRVFEVVHDAGSHLVSLAERLDTSAETGRMTVRMLQGMARFNTSGGEPVWQPELRAADPFPDENTVSEEDIVVGNPGDILLGSPDDANGSDGYDGITLVEPDAAPAKDPAIERALAHDTCRVTLELDMDDDPPNDIAALLEDPGGPGSEPVSAPPRTH
ncbi:MAG: recombinase family protein [Leptospirillia bacterium]